MSSRPTRRRRRRAEQAAELLLAREAPPWVVLVSGGALTAGASEKVRQYVKDIQKGFHSVLVLSPEDVTSTAGAGGRFSITVKQLGSAP